MTMLKLGEKEYEVGLGKELAIEDPEKIFGKWIKITTEEYELTATRTSVVNNVDTFVIDKIRYFNGKTLVLEPKVKEEPEPKHINFNSLKKAEIVEIASDLGFDTSVNRTKKEWIEMIESLGNSEEVF